MNSPKGHHERGLAGFHQVSATKGGKGTGVKPPGKGNRAEGCERGGEKGSPGERKPGPPRKGSDGVVGPTSGVLLRPGKSDMGIREG